MNKVGTTEPRGSGWWLRYSGNANSADTLLVGCDRELERADVLKLLRALQINADLMNPEVEGEPNVEC